MIMDTSHYYHWLYVMAEKQERFRKKLLFLISA